MACCGGKTGVRTDFGRYPKAIPDTSKWARSPNVADQFEAQQMRTQVGLKQDAPFTYSGANLAACQFPIGGFGAGYVILGGDGTFQAYNIVNQVRKESLPMHCMPAGFFAITATPSGEAAQSVLLASPETYTVDNCALPPNKPARVSVSSVKRLESLPGIQSLRLTGRYPIAEVQYNITKFPVDVQLEAFSPMCPLNDKDSSLPVGVFTFSVTNSGTTSVAVRVMQSQQNLVGWDGQTDCTQPSATTFWGGNVNTATASGILMSNPSQPSGADRSNEAFGTVAVESVSTSSAATTTVILDGVSEEDIYAKFTSNKDVAPVAGTATAASATGSSYCGGVVQSVTVAPGATETVTFVLAWHFPNRSNKQSCGGNPNLPTVLGNNYNNWFTDASAVADYTSTNIATLTATTRTYRDIMFSSTIPPELLDSAAGRVAHLRSPTMWWSEEGIVLGCEGNGCCPLNCTHVYGYTTLMERLYPNLAKDMRVSDFVRNYDASQGGCTMRYGQGGWAIDGALACIIKTYLVVRQADSTVDWLPAVWPNVKGQMNLIIQKFDTEGDGVIRAAQQNTYDTAMNGANTFIGSYYVTALRACAAMAELLGHDEDAKDFATRAATSSANYDKECWREDFGYYYAVVDSTDCKYSYGPGCFVDQLCCAGLSSAAGLGYLFNPAHEAAARKAILENNMVTKPPWTDLQGHLFAGDTAITVCTYPNGKLGDGMQYDTLVSTGFTSPVVAGMLLDRNTEGAQTIAGWIRTRQDGRNRSPWNEPECDLLYSRAMAHWNMFDQSTGFQYDAITGSLLFDPRFSIDDFQCFVVLQDGWGKYTQTTSLLDESTSVSLSCSYGTMTITSLTVQSLVTDTSSRLRTRPILANSSASATIDGVATAGTWDSDKACFTFSKEVSLAVSSTLIIQVTPGSDTVQVDMEFSKQAEDGTAPPSMRQRQPFSTSADRKTDGYVTATRVSTMSSSQPQQSKNRALFVVVGFVAMCTVFALGMWCAMHYHNELLSLFDNSGHHRHP